MNLRTFGMIFGFVLFHATRSRAAAAGSCARRPGICIEPVTDPVTLGEGPHWDDEAQVLYFVDIPSQKIYCYDPATKNTTHAYIKNGPVGVAVPVAGKKNTFVAGAGTDFVEVHWDPKTNSTDPKIKILATVDKDRKGTRFNDGKIDPSGRFWAGTMGIELEPDLGSLYRMDSDMKPERILTPVTISNGLTWSDDARTFYYIDSPTKEVNAFDYDQNSGAISQKRVVFDFTVNNVPGIPDGMTIDNAGNLWIASYDGGRIVSVNPTTGKLLKTIEIPAKQVTSVAFGGRNHDILYVTTARQGLKDEDLKSQPKAGSVFAINGLGVGGKPMVHYKM